MKRIILYIFIGFITSINLFSTKWEYGGLDGEAGITLLYKTLPPLIVDIEKTEILKVAKTNQSFKYSEVSDKRAPLNVNIEVSFNNEIINNNGVNKEIVRTIYNEVELSFEENGIFFLIENNTPIDQEIKTIEAEVFFTSRNGEVEGNGKKIRKILGDTIKDGKLQQNDIYIDAVFNSSKQLLFSGEYKGTVVLVIEFIGKGAIN